MKKRLILILASTISFSAYAELKAEVKGEFDFQSGVRFQDDLKDSNEWLSANQKKFAFYTEAYIKGLISNKTDDGLDYGASIFLRATTNQALPSSKNGSYLFVSHDNVGKLEAGSAFGVSNKMAVTYDLIEYGSGNWSDYAVVTPDKLVEYKYYSFYMSKFRTKIGDLTAEPPRSVSYYTPKFNGFQAGVTFTPDTSNAGGAGSSDTSSNMERKLIFKDKQPDKDVFISVKNAVGVGFNYENSPSDDLNIKLGLTGDYGTAIQKEKVNGKMVELTGDYKAEDLFGYNVGAVLTYKDISVSASYCDFGKSFSTPIVDKGRDKTVYYGLGAAYNNGPVGVSITYGNTDHRKNVVKSFTVGTQYKLAPGLVSYADVTRFEASGKDITDTKEQSTKGTILVFGLKLGI